MRLAALTTAVALASAPALAQEWDMPTPYPEGTFHTQNIMEFAKDVEEATDGALKITVHPAGSLFKHPDIMGAVRSQQVPIGEFLLSRLSNDDAVYGADSMPFLATSYEDAAKLWEAQKPEVEKLLAEQRLKPLYAVPWPPQGLYVTDEVTSVDDLSGLKFRAYNATLEELANKAGAAPTQVEVPDIPQAFSTGRVEAMMTSPTTGVNSQAWDFVSNFYDVQAWLPKNVIVVNQRAFDALDESVQQAVLDAAAKAQERGIEMSKAETEKMLAKLEEEGMTVHEPSEELMSGLKAIGDEMLASWKEEAGESGAAILEAYGQ